MKTSVDISTETIIRPKGGDIGGGSGDIEGEGKGIIEDFDGFISPINDGLGVI